MGSEEAAGAAGIAEDNEMDSITTSTRKAMQELCSFMSTDNLNQMKN